MARRLLLLLLMIATPAGALAADAPLTLPMAITRALAYAPAAELAAAQSDLGGARLEEARAPLMPSIFANSEYFQAPGYDQVITNRGLTLAQLALGYTVFDGGLRMAQLRAARYAQQAASLGIDAARQQIVFDTTVAYLDLWRERATAAELRRGVARLSQYVTTVQSLLRSGRAISNDVLKIESARDSVQMSLAAANAAVDHAAILLGSLIDQPDPQNLLLADLPPLAAPPAGDLTRSPAYAAAQRQVAAATSLLQAARDERSPTLKVTLTSGWEGIDPPKTFGHHLGASYDGAVSVPIFQGGLVRSHIDAAGAQQHIARAQLRTIQLSLKRDFADARSRFDAAIRTLTLLRQSQSTADDAFALDWTRFLGGGNVALLEVIDSFQVAQNLRVARLDNEFAARQAVAQANLLLGNNL